MLRSCLTAPQTTFTSHLGTLVFRLLREGLIELIEQCVAECNTCTCSFCTTHNAAAAEAKAKSTASVPVNYPPQSSEKLWEAMFCPKQAAPADSGFIGTLPCYELGCQMKYLQGKQMAFIDGTGNNPALLDPVPQPRISRSNRTLAFRYLRSCV